MRADVSQILFMVAGKRRDAPPPLPPTLPKSTGVNNLRLLTQPKFCARVSYDRVMDCERVITPNSFMHCGHHSDNKQAHSRTVG